MQISVVMDKFESQFSDLDVQTSYMESTMSDTTALTTPQDQVDTLISQVADENGLEISQKVGQGNVPAATPVAAVQEREGGLEEDGKLAERLRALRVSQRDSAAECDVGMNADV
jgi:charged multivesicular body protein 1